MFDERLHEGHGCTTEVRKRRPTAGLETHIFCINQNSLSELSYELNASPLQVIASVLRNLSWRADVNSKKILREVGSVRALMECALEVQKVRRQMSR